jgi:predicted enzyme related to lactoylglutathione lyase
VRDEGDRKTAEAERLVALGARVVDEHADRGPRTIVTQDPEGNEFCLH